MIKILGLFKKQEKGYHTKSIQQYKNGILLRTYKSINEMQRKTGFNRSHVVECCKGRRHTAYGYKWQYTNMEVQ